MSAGPAGLAAAICLARFRPTLRVFDAGGMRASAEPLPSGYCCEPPGGRLLK